MYRKLWNRCHQSVCGINFFSAKGIRFNSVTGFRHGKYIITDEMVYHIENASEVQISFYEDDGCTIKTSVKITDKDFRMRMVKGVRENIGSFALIDLDLPQFDNIPSLNYSKSKKTTIASSIALIGFHYQNANLAIKTGIISSNLKSNGSRFIQFDAAVDRGNSGSPLIDVETGEVIGIVGHRMSKMLEGYKK
jgi:S1-C subfamily serine protease